MMPFGAYAKYYDLMYREKDYAAETRFVHRLLQNHMPGAQTVLDLGCGTGLHAAELVRLGYAVHGVDRSSDMLLLCDQRRAGLDEQSRDRLGFSGGDVRNVRLGRVFDAVIALFHVMSYQITDDDIRDTLNTAQAHLRGGGLLVFDFWNGSAVLRGGPLPRRKQVTEERVSVTRVAEPLWDEARSLVHVRYKITARSLDSGEEHDIDEVHTLRYLFEAELVGMLQNAGFAVHASGAWLTDLPAGPDAWSAYVAARCLSGSL